jgi:hypothetical protein
MGNLIELFKATRVHRALLPVAAMLVPCAFAGRITPDIIFLGIACVLVYMGASIQNADKDGDYSLPGYHKAAMLFLFVVAIVVSFFNLIVFLTVVAWFAFGAVYNMISRYYVLADTTIMAITHFTIPVFSGSFILGLPLNLTLILTAFTFVTFWFIMPMKNLVGSDEDKARGYKTLTTWSMNGRNVTIILLEISFICMFLAYFVLELSKKYLLVLILLFALRIVIFRNIEKKREKFAVDLMRIAILLYLFGLIIDRTLNLVILGLFMSVFLSYVPYMISSFREIASE